MTSPLYFNLDQLDAGAGCYFDGFFDTGEPRGFVEGDSSHWLASSFESTGLLVGPPAFFHFDGDYPGMMSFPSAFSGENIYAARFVWGEPYPASGMGSEAVPEGKLWLSVIPLALGAAATVRRRMKLARNGAGSHPLPA